MVVLGSNRPQTLREHPFLSFYSMMISLKHAISKSKVKIICTLYQLLMSTLQKKIMLNSLHLMAASMAIKKPLSNYWNAESEFNP